MSEPTVRVFVVDEKAATRQGLRRLLEQETDLRFVGEAGSPGEAGEKLEQQVPDVAIIGVGLSEEGIELCRQLLSSHPRIKCLVLATLDDDEALLEAILLGAKGLLRERAERGELASAIRAAASGQWLLEPVIAARSRDNDVAQGEAKVLLDRLSEQERRVAELVAKGLLNREIANELHLSEKTVRNYVSRMLAKLRVRNRTQLAALFVRLAADR